MVDMQKTKHKVSAKDLFSAFFSSLPFSMNAKPSLLDTHSFEVYLVSTHTQGLRVLVFHPLSAFKSM